MKRREFVTLLCAVVASPISAQGQQTAKVRTVGFLYPGNAAAASPRVAAFLAGLRTRGLREPDVEIVAQITGGDATLLVPMANNLVKTKSGPNSCKPGSYTSGPIGYRNDTHRRRRFRERSRGCRTYR